MAFWAVLLAASIAGLSGLLIKSMQINPVSQAWLRMATPTVVTAIWLVMTGVPLLQGNWKKMSLVSVLGTVRMIFFFIAYTYATIGNAVIIFYTFPVFSALLSKLILKEKITPRQVILLIMAFIGILLAFSNKPFDLANNDLIGMLAAMASALIYALTVVLFKSESKNYSLPHLLFYQNAAGLFLLAPFFQFREATTLDYSIGIGYGLLIGILAFSLFFYGLKKLKASTASALMYMEVVSALTLSVIFFEEQLTLPMILGAILIVGSSLLLKSQ